MAQSSYQNINLTADIDLSWPFSYTGTNIVCDINDIVPDAEGHKIKLPAANLTGPGQNFIFNNKSGFSFDIVDNAGVLVATIGGYNADNTPIAPAVVELYLVDTSTPAGSWQVILYGQGASAGIGSLTVTSPNIVITDSNSKIVNDIYTTTINNATGSIDLSLPLSISRLSKLNKVGIPVIANIDNNNEKNILWDVVELSAGDNITIEYGNGGGGNNPVIELNDTIAIDSITSQNTDGNIKIIAGGDVQIVTNEGNVSMNGVSVDKDGVLTAADVAVSELLIAKAVKVGELTLSDDKVTNNKTNGNVRIVTENDGKVLINGVSVDKDGVLTAVDVAVSELLIAKAVKVGELTLSDDKIVNANPGANIHLNTSDVGRVIINNTVAVDSNGHLSVGRLFIQDNKIINSDNFSKIILSPGQSTSTGEVIIEGKLTVSGKISNPLIPKVYCVFTDTNNTINCLDQVGVKLKVGSTTEGDIERTEDGIYKITFDVPLVRDGYGVLVTLGGVTNENVKFGRCLLKNEEYVLIGVTDLSGQPVLDLSEGMTVMIMSSKG